MIYPTCTELMAECMSYMYGKRLDAIPLSEKAQALKKSSPNKSNKKNRKIVF